jgi:epoxyqueuosine reductase
VLEKALGAKAGLGWMGKHTLLLNEEAGSWFFLGEIYTNAPLALSHQPVKEACGKCNACITVCPTQADRWSEKTRRTTMHLLSDH